MAIWEVYCHSDTKPYVSKLFVHKAGEVKNAKVSFILFLPRHTEIAFQKFQILDFKFFTENIVGATYGFTECQKQRTITYYYCGDLCTPEVFKWNTDINYSFVLKKVCLNY